MWKEKHLKVMVRQNGRTLALKAWNFAPRAAEFAAGTRVDVAFAIEEDAYSAARGYPGWAAVLREVRAAASGARTRRRRSAHVLIHRLQLGDLDAQRRGLQIGELAGAHHHAAFERSRPRCCTPPPRAPGCGRLCSSGRPCRTGA